MAKFVFGMNLSLDGYADHEAFAPDEALSVTGSTKVRHLTGSEASVRVRGRPFREVDR